MKIKLALTVMSLFSLFGCRGGDAAPALPCDRIAARDGSEIEITFIGHASLSLCWNGFRIYVDPAGEGVDWAKMPAADAVLITHSHFDHFDMAAVDALRRGDCAIICDKTTAEAFEHDCTTMLPGSEARPVEGVSIKAVPAYNISEGHTQFHPREREDCGYVVTLGGTNIYIAGDTEDNDDILALRNIDIAFLPVNQPYTMTVEQAARVVAAIRPQIFYPYHYGQVEQRTDLSALVAATEGVCEVRVRPME